MAALEVQEKQELEVPVLQSFQKKLRLLFQTHHSPNTARATAVNAPNHHTPHCLPRQRTEHSLLKVQLLSSNPYTSLRRKSLPSNKEQDPRRSLNANSLTTQESVVENLNANGRRSAKRKKRKLVETRDAKPVWPEIEHDFKAFKKHSTNITLLLIH